MSIYKPCDIRGPASDLSVLLYRQWGEAIGRSTFSGPIAVAGDVRSSTPAFLAALIEGFCVSGRSVLDLGIVPTPLVYFVKRQLKLSGCAVVTASHSPPEINGLKWMIGDWPPTEKEVQGLAVAVPAGEKRQCGVRFPWDPWSDYLRFLETSLTRPARGLRVVVDPGGGCWSGHAGRLLRELYPAHQFDLIHDEADGSFRMRDPDSARPEHLTALSSTVQETGADIGIAFDGDGDRVAFVDEQGKALTAEEATWVLLDVVADRLAGRSFVHDIKFSDRIGERAVALGARRLVERSGHAFIRRRMRAERAAFGAEISGHYFFEELEGGDDGLYAACRVLDALARRPQPLSALRRECPVLHLTPDWRIPIEGSAAKMIEAVHQAFLDRPQKTIDGLRIDFPDGWALVRGSVTESKLTLRFEGTSADALERVVGAFQHRFPKWRLKQGDREGE